MRVDKGAVAVSSWVYRIFLSLLTVFTLWATYTFIIRSSAVGLDGRRVATLFDDGMISMRYALMLVKGHGLVWNVGEYVEGYTNPLWTLVMAAVISLAGKMFAPEVMMWLGGLCYTACAWVAFALGGHIAARVGLVGWGAFGAATMSATIVALYYPLLFWSVGGMEVAPLTLLVLLLFLVLERTWERTLLSRDALVFWALAITAYGLRPDAVLLVGLPLAVRLGLSVYQKDWVSTRRLLFVALGCAAMMASHLLWRFWYYGRWVPNTYTLKLTNWALSDRLVAGKRFIGPFLEQSAPLAILLLGLLASMRRFTAVTAVAGAAIGIGYQVWVGGDPWPYWRQLVPSFVVAMVVLVPLCTVALPKAWRWLMPVYLVFCVVMINSPFEAEIVGRTKPYHFQYHQTNLTTVQLLQRTIPQTETLAVAWAGLIPYFWQGPVKDILGKCDMHIANLPVHKGETVGHNKYDLDYTTSFRPAYIQHLRWGQDKNITKRNFYSPFSYQGANFWIRNDLIAGVKSQAMKLP